MASSSNEEVTDSFTDLDQPSSVGRSNRFRSTEDHEDDQLEEWISFKPCSKSNTKRQLEYTLSVFKDFVEHENKSIEDIVTDTGALDVLLSNFYKAARNRKGEFYSVKSMQSIRYGLHHYFRASHGLDILRRDEFVLSHRTFKAMVMKLKVLGKGRVTHHRITEDDMELLQASLNLSAPQGLQYKVFLDTMMFFGRFGMKNLRFTRPGDFVLHQENGQIFYTLGENREVQMHAMPGNPRCPVANLQKYLSKRCIKCEWMWQRPKQRCPDDPTSSWYIDSALGKTTLSLMTKTISESAGCHRGYTNHSLRTCMTKKMWETLSGNINQSASNSHANYAITVVTLPSTSNSIVAQVSRVNSARLPNAATTTAATAPTTTMATIAGLPMKSSELQNVTGSTSNRAVQQYTMKQDNSTPLKKAVDKGTMTDLTWTDMQKKLVQSKDAYTQWKRQVNLEQLSFHSAACSTSSNSLEQNCLCQCPDDIPVMEVDDDSDESIIRHGPEVSVIEAGSKDDSEEATCNLPKKGSSSSAPVMRRIKEEILDDPEEVLEDYQTIYIKEETDEDEYPEDDHVSVQTTVQQSSKEDGHSRMLMNRSRSTSPTLAERTLRPDEELLIGSKKMYKLKFHVSHGNTKEILTIDSPTDTVTAATVNEAVCRSLQGVGGGLSLQYFDESWQDWVDIEPSMSLRGRMRLKVILTSGGVKSRPRASIPKGQKAHRLQYLVTLGNSKQILTINAQKDTTSGATVMKAMSSMLRGVANNGLLLQYFDKDWQDWIDVEPRMVLGGRMRLRVVQASRN